MTQQIKNFAASIKIGNIKAFGIFLQTNRKLLTKSAASPNKVDKKLGSTRQPVRFSINKKVKTTLAIELSSDEEATQPPEKQPTEKQPTEKQPTEMQPTEKQPTEKQLSKIMQFVEVLTEDEKPTALLNLIQDLLCGNSKYSKSKVLVFATLSNVDMLYDYLNKYGRESTVPFPTVFTIPEGVKDEVRSQILSLFQHGILLISPYNFLNKMNQTGELIDYCVQ
jgi:hypothetical protein